MEHEFRGISSINGDLVGGDWLEHQFLNFPINQYWVSMIIPIDESSYFSEGWPNHQPGIIATMMKSVVNNGDTLGDFTNKN